MWLQILVFFGLTIDNSPIKIIGSPIKEGIQEVKDCESKAIETTAPQITKTNP
jgi:hypothetical protein